MLCLREEEWALCSEEEGNSKMCLQHQPEQREAVDPPWPVPSSCEARMFYELSLRPLKNMP